MASNIVCMAPDVNENELVLVLEKLVETGRAKTAREGVKPGSYKVDQIVRINGTMNVAPDYMKTPTVSIPLKETMALLLHYSGFTREKSKEILIKSMRTAIARKMKENRRKKNKSPISGKGELANNPDLDFMDEALADVESSILKKLPKTPSKGPVTAKLEVFILAGIPTPAPDEVEVGV